jgi:hypothetical protein
VHRLREEQHSALQEKLNRLKESVMHGFGIQGKHTSQGEPDLEVELARKERERRRMQAKLRAKKRKEARLEAERLQVEQTQRPLPSSV